VIKKLNEYKALFTKLRHLLKPLNGRNLVEKLGDKRLPAFTVQFAELACKFTRGSNVQKEERLTSVCASARRAR
jgi:hypothetical protein